MALICIFIFAHTSLSYIQLRLALEVLKDTEKEQKLEKLEISSLKYTGGGTSPEALLEAPAHAEAGLQSPQKFCQLTDTTWLIHLGA